MNEALLTRSPGNVSPNDLFEALPDSGSDFSVTYTGATTFDKFYEKVFEQNEVGNSLPYRFGTYSIYQADTNNQIY